MLIILSVMDDKALIISFTANRQFKLTQGEYIRLSEGPVKAQYWPKQFFETYLPSKVHHLQSLGIKSDDNNHVLCVAYGS